MDSRKNDDLDKQIRQSEALIDEAKETIKKTKRLLQRAGLSDGASMSDLLQSDDCPEELRERARLDQDSLSRELEEEEQKLIDEYIKESKNDVGKQTYRPKKPRMRM